MDKAGSPTLLNCLMYKMSYYRFGEMQVSRIKYQLGWKGHAYNIEQTLLSKAINIGVVRVQSSHRNQNYIQNSFFILTVHIAYQSAF